MALRALLSEQGGFDDWKNVHSAGSSELLFVGCERGLDRYRLRRLMTDKEVAESKRNLIQFLEAVTLFAIDTSVLRRAGESFPTTVGTLDAIHLSTALRWRESLGERVVIVSHDEQLIVGAQALGLEVWEGGS